ncbi:MAG: hypothetical protein R3E66_04650 [bacterium]
MAEIRAAAPDLHKRYENARNLAYMAHSLEPGISDELFRTRASYDEWWKKWFEPDNFFDRNLSSINVNPSGVDPREIKDATLEGDKLVYYSGRVIAADHGIQAFRNEVDFSSDDWTPKIEELQTSGQVRTRINEGAIAIFGGLAEGFVHAKSATGDVYLSSKPQSGAAAFVWRDTDKKIERFTTWAELMTKHPEAGSAEVAAELAEGIVNYPLNESLQLIKDSDAYKKEYKDSNWGVEKLRYWVDQLRVTEFTIVNWDTIVNPEIRNGAVVAHFKRGNRQPARMTYTLDDFAKGTPAEVVDLFTATVVSDTKDGPGLPRPINTGSELEFDVVPAPHGPKPKLAK